MASIANERNGIPQEVYLEELDTLTLSCVEISPAGAGHDSKGVGETLNGSHTGAGSVAGSISQSSVAASQESQPELTAKERRAKKLAAKKAAKKAAKAAKAAKKRAEAEAAEGISQASTALTSTSDGALSAKNNDLPTNISATSSSSGKENASSSSFGSSSTSHVAQEEASPQARGGATLTYLPSTRQLLLLGGADRTNHTFGFKEPHVFNVTTRLWSKLVTSGEAPWPRHGHTATLNCNGSSLYVFGGIHESSGNCYNDLHELHLESLTWRKLDVGGSPHAPAPRNSHTACLATVDGRELVYIFGGSSPRNGLMGDLAAFDITDRDNVHWADECFTATTGFTPQPRECHSCTGGGTTGVLRVYGGRGEDRVHADLCVLDLSSRVWDEPKDTKMPRMAHASVDLGSVHMAVVAGCDGRALLGDFLLLNTEKNMWTEPKLEPNAPAPRMALSICLSAPTPDCLYVFGGSTPEREMGDLHIVAVTTLPTVEDETVDAAGAAGQAGVVEPETSV